jgi:hypothetical protein
MPSSRQVERRVVRLGRVRQQWQPELQDQQHNQKRIIRRLSKLGIHGTVGKFKLIRPQIVIQSIERKITKYIPSKIICRRGYGQWVCMYSLCLFLLIIS